MFIKKNMKNWENKRYEYLIFFLVICLVIFVIIVIVIKLSI